MARHPATTIASLILILPLLCFAPSLALALEKVVVCQGGSLQTLYTLAAETGAFGDAGLDVELRSYTVGAEAFNALFEGKCDFASAAEMPIVMRSFKHNDVVVVATTRSSNDQSWILARADRGIAKVEDLAGRIMGIPKGTAPHFFAEMLLAKHGVRPDKYVEKYISAPELEKKIVEGSVDAITMPALQISRIAKILGDKAVIFREPGLCLNFGVLNVTRKYLSEKTQTVENLLKALIKSQKFLEENPAQAREIIMKSSKFTSDEYDRIMRENTDAVTLPNGLLLTMEDCARWAIERKFVDSQRMPNYLNFIDEKVLKVLSPNVVTIAR